jgi:dCMP deaminase
MSHCVRAKVGAIAVKDDRVLSMGFNGTPSGYDNTCEYTLEDGTLKTKAEVLHAELNCIAKLAKSSESSDKCTMYITLAPCIECAKLMLQSGISRVIYKDDYKSKDGIALLRNMGVSVYKYAELFN